MAIKEKGIKLSPKYGVNPSITHCICCGKAIGLALLGKLKNDEEAPHDVYEGLCEDCEKVIESGGVIFIEVKDGESGKENPYRTGRIIGFGKDFVDKFNIPHPIMYCEHAIFDKNFGKLLESRVNEIQNNEN